jgi:hypothetical protein
MYMAELETARRLKLPAYRGCLVRQRPLADCHVAGTARIASLRRGLHESRHRKGRGGVWRRRQGLRDHFRGGSGNNVSLDQAQAHGYSIHCQLRSVQSLSPRVPRKRGRI